MLPTFYRRRASFDPSLTPITRDIDRMFEELFDLWRGNGAPVAEETAAYPIDVREADGKIFVDAELPGFDKDEVDVTIEQGIVNITAEHKEQKERKPERGKTYVCERRYRRIQRSFTLPTAVDESKIEANLRDGVLHLEIPKAKEAMTQKVAIK